MSTQGDDFNLQVLCCAPLCYDVFLTPASGLIFANIIHLFVFIKHLLWACHGEGLEDTSLFTIMDK